jgi:hypothetical protein
MVCTVCARAICSSEWRKHCQTPELSPLDKHLPPSSQGRTLSANVFGLHRRTSPNSESAIDRFGLAVPTGARSTLVKSSAYSPYTITDRHRSFHHSTPSGNRTTHNGFYRARPRHNHASCPTHEGCNQATHIIRRPSKTGLSPHGGRLFFVHIRCTASALWAHGLSTKKRRASGSLPTGQTDVRASGHPAVL